MPTYGAELPPHLQAKRARDDASDDETRPDQSPRGTAADKRQRVMGPAMPPAPLDERPIEPADDRSRTPDGDDDSDDDSDSDEDDDLGPAPPSASESTLAQPEPTQSTASTATAATATASAAAQTKRDEWMIVPPQQDDLAARMDPSRVRARGFNTGKSARNTLGTSSGTGSGATGAGQVDNSSWTETPEQTRRRMADEVLGKTTTGAGTGAGIARVGGAGGAGGSGGSGGTRGQGSVTGLSRDDIRAQRKRDADAALAARIQDSKGKSLYERHRESNRAVPEDDPSQRTFDRERDMAIGGGGSAGGTARRGDVGEMSAGFSSKFSGGSYL